MTKERLDLDKPRWDLNTFSGRLRYFAWITNPLLSLHSSESLEKAKILVQQYKHGSEPPGTSTGEVIQAQQLYLSAYHPDTGELQNAVGRMSFQVPGGMVLIGAMVTFYRYHHEPPGTTKEQIIKAQQLYLSAFHPDSGELQNVLGRMAFQVPSGMVIMSAMIVFYKSNVAVIFWQWANQSFNALVNYTNRNAASDVTPRKIAFAYVTATTSALVTALGLKAYLAKAASPLLQRFVPFAAVCAANMVNIPLMRQSELIDGIVVTDENSNTVTQSRYAAIKGISQVVFSRIVMCSPSMILLPILMENIEKRPFMLKYGKFINAPMQVFLSGLSLLVMVPLGCALFNQRCSIKVDRLKLLDKERYSEVETKYGKALPETLYFNKGL